ncbi:MAG: hypothetical protein MJY95_08230 [Bacteroidaceae bacterium]|nr:hypothetical protein [Bacteroidaceae bacterium]
MSNEQRWEFRYINGNGIHKVAYPRNEAEKERCIKIAKEKGFEIESCKKMYPFSMNKNQHNFELIANICANTLYDMMYGDIKFDGAEFDRLEHLKDRAEHFFCMGAGIVWLTYEDYREAKELSEMAIMHREEACIRAGRYDLVKYC